MVDRSRIGLESLQQGEDFQDELALAWAAVPKSWRMRIRDGGNGDRPADEIVLLSKYRVLCEAKRTKSTVFNIKNLVKINQIKGLIAFDKCCKFNLGVLAIHFSTQDEVYIVKMSELFKYAKLINKFAVHYSDFKSGKFPRVYVKKKNGILFLSDLEERVGELDANSSK